MKIGVLGFAIASVAVSAVMSLSAMAQETTPTEPSPLAVTNPNANGTSPASVEALKEKIEAINNSSSLKGVEDVVKLYQAGVDTGVIETYIRNSRIPAPTPKDLVYLHEQKVPQDLVKALIEHGQEVSQQAANTPTVGANTSNPAAYGPTYNNYVYTVPDSTYGYNYAAPSSQLTIIPYNPSRTTYAADFNARYWNTPYVYGGIPYWPYMGLYYGSYYGGGYCGPYRSGYGYGHWGPRRYAYQGPYRGGGIFYRGRR